ncbi:alpha/beta fold hydrolase [Paenibacillus sp. IB182496]|uniref:Alpha/beta fold hydrolase n=1 Tax=Paenibacillus sabuli TaxID=2772509 RepID=A0A927BZ12_9BACL|nr:alpha/beta fold hydrolase [Paenibacillus sabuli]MBD2848360.1 alpha/beta fold hydrolase [Paenibacillus sabuli]
MSSSAMTPYPLEAGYAAPSHAPPHTEPVFVSRSRRLWVACAAALALVLFAAVAFHGFIAWRLAYPYVAPLQSNPLEAKSLAYEDIAFPSASGATMVDGWYIPAADDSARTVIFSHGYGANREESWVPMYDLAELMHGLDYNVVMFDYGYASASDKSPATGGREESQQLLSAIRYARSNGADEVVIWGFSMGAGTALQTALQTDLIDAMILDSTFLPDPEALFHNVTQLVSLPRFPSLQLLQALLPLWSGTGFGAIPYDRVLSTTYAIPIYMVHGTADSKAPLNTARLIAQTQTHPLSGEWVVENGLHEMLFRVHPDEYISRVSHFLDQVHAQRLLALAAAS